MRLSISCDIAPFFAKEWQTHRRIRAIYTTGGSAVVPYDDLSTYTGALSVFFVTHPELAIDLYSENSGQSSKMVTGANQPNTTIKTGAGLRLLCMPTTRRIYGVKIR